MGGFGLAFGKFGTRNSGTRKFGDEIRGRETISPSGNSGTRDLFRLERRPPHQHHTEKTGGAHGEAPPPRDSSYNERLSRIICLQTNPRIIRHIPTHSRSGCAAIRHITREMSRYMTHDPRNESIYAPLRLLMAHISTHFAGFGRKRSHRNDERTRGIDDRTRLGHERTRVLRTNPSGQLVAVGSRNPLIERAFLPTTTVVTEPSRKPDRPRFRDARTDPRRPLIPPRKSANIPNNDTPAQRNGGVQGRRCLPWFRKRPGRQRLPGPLRSFGSVPVATARQGEVPFRR